MIIFLYGPDTYRSLQKLKEIITHYKEIHKSGLNLKYFDFKKDSFEDFRDSFRSQSMFDEKKLMILKNVFSESSLTENFENFLDRIIESQDIVVFHEEKIDKKNTLVKSLMKQGKSQRFDLLMGKSLRNWIKKEFKRYSTEIEIPALNLLSSSVGNDLWRMANEIRKLVNYKDKKKITTEDVKLLVRPKVEADIFKTIDAIAAKDKNKALSFIKRHLEKGDSPSYILAMINFQFRNLLIVKELMKKGKSFFNIQKEVNLHPFVIKKSYALAKKFSFEELKTIHQKIFEADLNIKTGKIDAEGALEVLTLGI